MVDIVVLLLLMLINGIFAMAEISFISSKKNRLQKLADDGNKRANIVLKLISNNERFLSIVQIGMTGVSIVAGAYSGTTIAHNLEIYFSQYPFIGQYAAAVALFSVVIFTTFLTLVVGELVPKSIGLNRPEQIALLVAPIMQLLSVITSPIIWFLELSTRFVLRILGIRKSEEPTVTEEDLQQLIEQGSEEGVIEKTEGDLLREIFRVGDRKVNSLMTHRGEIIWLNLKLSQQEVINVIMESNHTYFPVCDEELDEVKGMVSIKDVFRQLLDKQTFDLKKIMLQPLFVPETMPVLELLETFRNARTHSGLIVNEYGTLEGIVTLHDIMEAIAGDLPAQSSEEQEAIQRNDGSWLIDGMMQTPDWCDVIGLKDLSDEETGNYTTLGGFMMHQLGKIPKVADQFEFNGFNFEVMDMDDKRVDKVLVKKTEQNEGEESKTLH